MRKENQRLRVFLAISNRKSPELGIDLSPFLSAKHPFLIASQKGGASAGLRASANPKMMAAGEGFPGRILGHGETNGRQDGAGDWSLE